MSISRPETHGAHEREREQVCTQHEPEEHPSVRFASVLVLSKREAFELCEACAEAERALLRCGKACEAARMAALFELAEGRLASK